MMRSHNPVTLIAALAVVFALGGAQCEPTRPVFADEFTGTRLNLNRWQPNWLGPNNTAITKPVNEAEESCYDPANVRVGGGYLHLIAQRRPCTDNHGTGWAYASGLVNTNGHQIVRTGRYEARVKVVAPDGRVANWPAVWTTSASGWRSHGEMDVTEGLDGRWCWHYHSPAAAPGGCWSGPSAGWHTFSGELRAGPGGCGGATPDSVRATFVYDGQQVGAVNACIRNTGTFLVLNYGISRTLSPPVIVPSEMLVDYVRLYP